MDEIAFREMKSEDRHYILASWLRTYRQESQFAQFIRDPIYYDWHSKIIESILARPHTQVTLVTDKEDPNLIFGYLVNEHAPNSMNTIHFIHIKGKFRRFGLAKKLLAYASPDFMTQACQFTHWTFDLDRYFRFHPEMREVIVYNPYGI